MTATATRKQKMAERMAILHELLHDPTVQVTTLDILSGRETGEPDTDRTVGLRLVRPLGDPDPSSPAAPSEPDAGPGIDPRFRARRIAVRRAHGRRRLGRVAAIASVIGTVALAWGVTRSPLLDVDRVAVAGAQRTAAADVVAATGIRPREPLVDVDLDEVAAGVEDLTWVASVEVDRHWPGTVVVRVRERRPVAVAAVESGEWAVLSTDGQVMEVTAEPPDGLVRLVDVPPIADDGELDPVTVEAMAVASRLPASLATRVLGIGPDAEGRVELRLDPAGVVHFGSLADLDAKLVAADAVLAQGSSHCIAMVDVGVPEAPVLTRRPECG